MMLSARAENVLNLPQGADAVTDPAMDAVVYFEPQPDLLPLAEQGLECSPADKWSGSKAGWPECSRQRRLTVLPIYAKNANPPDRPAPGDSAVRTDSP